MVTAEQTVFVAGASRGIGRACAEAFHHGGARVAAISRTIDEAGARERYLPIRADLTRPGEAERAVERSRSSYGPITTVVHCVGDIPAPEPVGEIRWQRWLDTLEVCLGSAIHVVRPTRSDVAASRGSYVFVSSIGAARPYPGISDYCAAKAALSSLMRSLALDLAPAGARANAVSPAVVNTDILRRAPFSEEEAASWHKLGRVGRPEEIARACLYLASADASWITGQDLVLDGGMGL